MTTYYASSDIGGTFADTAVLDSVGQLRRYKASTAPDDPVKGVLAAPTASAAATGGPATQGSRRIYANGGWRDAVVFAEGAIRPGFAFDGPAVVEFDDTTLIVGAGQRGEVDAHPNVTIIPKD
jgi:N-methylhydantoinase A/oxoprolinase/acetone carboxylase beta subunit